MNNDNKTNEVAEQEAKAYHDKVITSLDTIIALLESISKQLATINSDCLTSNPAPTKSFHRKAKRTLIANIVFALCLTALLAGTVFYSIYNKHTSTASFFGINLYNVKTDSMEPLYPVGSLIFTKRVNPHDLEVGDDITVAVKTNDNSFFLTHRIIEIMNKDASLLFRTKGISSRVADKVIFNEDDITGRVIFCIPTLGKVMSFIGQNWIYVLLLILCIVSLMALIKSKGTVESKEPVSSKKQINKNKFKERGLCLRKKA